MPNHKTTQELISEAVNTVDWNTCPEKIVRNNEEDLCKLSGKECYREECNKIKEMENGRN